MKVLYHIELYFVTMVLNNNLTFNLSYIYFLSS